MHSVVEQILKRETHGRLHPQDLQHSLFVAAFGWSHKREPIQSCQVRNGTSSGCLSAGRVRGS